MKLYPNITQASWILAISLILVVTSCGLSIPSESDGQKALKNRHPDKMIATFKKIDGQLAEVFGVKAYRMKYEAIIDDVCPGQGGCRDYTGRDIKNGEKWQYQWKGTIEFTKSENGWGAVNFTD